MQYHCIEYFVQTIHFMLVRLILIQPIQHRQLFLGSGFTLHESKKYLSVHIFIFYPYIFNE